MRLIEIQVLVIVALVTAILLTHFPVSFSRAETVLSDLMGVSGIIAGIMIAYLSAKIFQIRGERLKRAEEIRQLSLKLTAFRKLLYRVINSHEFWVRHSDISSFKARRRKIEYADLHDYESDDEAVSSFWSGSEKWHSATIDLFLSMEAIIDEKNAPQTWAFDPAYEPNYSLGQLQKYWHPSNQIWYYLDGRYGKHMRGMINDEGINIMYQSDLPELASRIDPKYKEEDSARMLLAAIGSDFHLIYIPKLAELTHLNTRELPRPVLLLFTSLVLIMVFGVIFPLTIQSMMLELSTTRGLIVICVSAVITSVVGLLALLFNLLNIEVSVGNGT